MHLIRAECLELGLDVADFLGHRIKVEGDIFEVVPDWVGWLQPGIDWLRERPGELFIEHTVTLDRWMPGQFGTLDSGVFDPETVVVQDYKGGAGEKVEVKRNKQIMLYALGFWDNVVRHQSEATRFVLSIDQPRAGGISTWETTLDELLAFGKEARKAAARTYDKDAPLHASPEACRWCAIKTTCEEHARFVLDLFGTKFEDLDADALAGAEPTLPNEVTLDRRSYIIEHAGMFSSWLNALHAEALADALAGRPTPGLKAVEGRAGARRWSDEQKAGALLKKWLGLDEAFPRSMVSPTQAEKMMKTAAWDQVKGLVTRPQPKPVLVPETDKREAIQPIHTRFEDLSENQEENENG